jgi:hypothetical protein
MGGCTAKKRKPLDSPENQIVYSVQEPERTPTPATPEPIPTPLKQRKPSSSSESSESTLIKKLQAFQKAPTVRFTVDLSESLRRKLAAATSKAGCKKVDIVRMLLENGLKDFDA